MNAVCILSNGKEQFGTIKFTQDKAGTPTKMNVGSMLEFRLYT